MADIRACTIIFLFLLSFVFFVVDVKANEHYGYSTLHIFNNCVLWSFKGQIECEAQGCYWWDSACHSLPAGVASPIFVEQTTFTNDRSLWLVMGLGISLFTLIIGFLIRGKINNSQPPESESPQLQNPT